MAQQPDTIRLTQNAIDNWDEFIDKVSDIPSSQPGVAIPVNWAGVTNVRVPLRLKGFESQFSSSIGLGCSLPADRRGVHMSRFIEDILATSQEEHTHIVHLAQQLAYKGRIRNQSQKGSTSIRAEGFLKSWTSHSNKPSLEPIQLLASSVVTEESVCSFHGVRLQIMTACPCTQTFTRYTLARKLAERFDITNANEILEQLTTETHVQRAWLTCEVEDSDGEIGSIEMVQQIQSVVSTPQELLKRPDEHDLVRRCHDDAQFTEDIVRNVAAALISHPKRLAPTTQIRLKVVAEESIHPHNATATLNTNLEEILRFID